MKKLFGVAVCAAVAGLSAPVVVSHAWAQSAPSTVVVGGMAMYPSKSIVANAVNSSDHTTLVAGILFSRLPMKLSAIFPRAP
jgi:hypothetical protein